jgi:RNA-directed DNA polymerase
MTTTPISLQDLRRRIYVTAKADKTKRFWGLYVHVVKRETLRTAYALAKRNNGAPGIDGVTFAAIEAAGVEAFLAQLRDELVTRIYRPLRNRRVEIPKRGGKVRVLGIPAIRDRVVQGALKLILEPMFEADFCNGSYGYRPRRTAHEAVARVDKDIVEGKTRVIDVDLAAYFDTVRHDLLLGKVARRVQDGEILHLLKVMLKASGKRGVPQGGVLSPLLANIYLTEVDAMLERATTVTQEGAYTRVDYARYADDLVILVDWHRRHDWLLRAVHRRLREELAKLALRLNEEKSRTVDLRQGEAFGFLGFDFRRVRSLRGVWRAQVTAQAHTADGVADKTQGSVPTVSVTTGGSADRGDQPDPAGVGELLPDRERETVSGLCEAVGRAEGAAPSDEGEGPSRLRLEEVEYGVAL